MRLWLVLFGVFGLLIVIGLVAVQREPAAVAVVESGDADHSAIDIPPGHGYGGAGFGRQLDISPDGTQIIYVGSDLANHRLYRRVLGQSTATPIAGTEGAGEPVFSPDGSSVAFYADRSLKLATLDGSSISVIATVNRPRGIAWLDEDTLILGNVAGHLIHVSISRGDPTVYAAEGPQLPHLAPNVLPGGKAILFTAARNSLLNARVSLFIPATGEQRELLDENGFAARYVPTGHIVFARGAERALMAARFDLKTLTISGPEQRVVETPLGGQGTGGSTDYSFSSNGTLLYRPRKTEEIDDILASMANLDLTKLYLRLSWFEELKRRIP